MTKRFKKYNIYRDYYGFVFTKIYWSRMVFLHIDKESGLYKCNCCNKNPLECANSKSVNEYKKLQMIYDISHEVLGCSQIDVPIYQTGWIRADNNLEATLCWKIQREMAKKAGFTLRRSSFF